MKTGLVLGAGGVVGAAWLIGALEALSDETGWDPSQADRIIGTSAGSVVGALVADGIPPALLTAYLAGKETREVDEADARAQAIAARLGGFEKVEELARTRTGDGYRLAFSTPPIGPGSWRMALSTLRHPRSHSASAMLAGWLPRGFISTGPIRELVETFVDGDWPTHDNFWAVTADYCTGRRVAFGREGAPRARVGEAVAASCAIPGFYHPVKIGGRRYIDGGICSMSNLDLLRGQELDMVVCLNPTSSLAALHGGTPTERIGGVMRAASGKWLGSEARKLREEGTEVVILQPSAEDLRLMGLNLMARGRRVGVAEQARRSTALSLRELRSTRTRLPGRTRRRRPAASAQRRAA